jgi:hypothetical protein
VHPSNANISIPSSSNVYQSVISFGWLFHSGYITLTWLV